MEKRQKERVVTKQEGSRFVRKDERRAILVEVLWVMKAHVLEGPGEDDAVLVDGDSQENSRRSREDSSRKRTSEGCYTPKERCTQNGGKCGQDLDECCCLIGG